MWHESRDWRREGEKRRAREAARCTTRASRNPDAVGNKTLAAVSVGVAGIAVLLAFGANGLLAPALALSPQGEASAEAAPRFPASGTVHYHQKPPGHVQTWPLWVDGPGEGVNAVVRVRRWHDDVLVATGFVESEGVTEFELAPGRYRVTVAQGAEWEGPERLFGHRTVLDELPADLTMVWGGSERIQLLGRPAFGAAPLRGRRRAAF